VADPLSEDRADLEPALARLPARQREAVVLRYFLDLSIDDTARVMRCTTGTVKSQVHKALATLREQLQHPDQPTQAGQP
jgi:RNA polymerase sigma factor (sigma-70 family)